MSARRRPIRNDVVAPLRAVPRESGDFPVVGIGASAGGLDAFQKFFDAQPPDSGIAFILIQHLDPTHASMMVELLSKHTTMHVQQATDGMVVQRNGVYAIAPGTYLAMRNGALRITEPRERHGARLPFDFLLHSLAEELGARAIGVILSGTGADGSIGLKAVKGSGGLVIAQDPDEAGFDGMPRSAISAGVVDRVLPVAKIPRALADHLSNTCPPADEAPLPKVLAPDPFAAIIDLLRTGTAHDFTQYKQGTLKRRIERRMSLVAIESDDMGRYLELLRNDAKELGLLANDLLINVTRFFRDPKVFDLLAETVIPELLRDRAPDQPLRIWIAGCSTGEETYSLAMIIREQITAAKLDIKLQVFASDVDPDAIARARESAYPKAIEADVSPARLARFFTWDGHSYKVLPALRAAVVFTVQDVLVDPPFSRLDFISCRNLLIYLKPQAQARVIGMFQFALRPGGVLLLGTSETLVSGEAGFTALAKRQRIWQRRGTEARGPAEPPEPAPAPRPARAAPQPPSPPPREAQPARKPRSRIATLERELETTRAELRGAIQDLESSAEEQRAVNEEALSTNEEYQSTNEELVTSKEELQSLNEELTVLNSQLQETLEQSRTNSTDLQNVLYSTREATIFLDRKLCIRFFTPATLAVFNVLTGDIGRPLADLRSLAEDAALLEDAAAVR